VERQVRSVGEAPRSGYEESGSSVGGGSPWKCARVAAWRYSNTERPCWAQVAITLPMRSSQRCPPALSASAVRQRCPPALSASAARPLGHVPIDHHKPNRLFRQIVGGINARGKDELNGAQAVLAKTIRQVLRLRDLGNPECRLADHFQPRVLHVPRKRSPRSSRR
jgi:hypothetical protein